MPWSCLQSTRQSASWQTARSWSPRHGCLGWTNRHRLSTRASLPLVHVSGGPVQAGVPARQSAVSPIPVVVRKSANPLKESSPTLYAVRGATSRFPASAARPGTASERFRRSPADARPRTCEVRDGTARPPTQSSTVWRTRSWSRLRICRWLASPSAFDNPYPPSRCGQLPCSRGIPSLQRSPTHALSYRLK